MSWTAGWINLGEGEKTTTLKIKQMSIYLVLVINVGATVQ